MKINTNLVLKNLASEPLKEGDKEITLGMALGGILLNGDEGGKMKLFVLAQKFYTANGEVEVDASDFAMIQSCVKNAKLSPVIVSGQVEMMLADMKE